MEGGAILEKGRLLSGDGYRRILCLCVWMRILQGCLCTTHVQCLHRPEERVISSCEYVGAGRPALIISCFLRNKACHVKRAHSQDFQDKQYLSLLHAAPVT